MIEAIDLRLKRGARQVLNGVSLRVDQGQVLGLLGRNGAGKTTTLKVFCGLLKPDSGSVNVSGVTSLGCLIETPGFYPNLTAPENLLLFSRDRSAAGRQEIHRALALLGLSGVEKRVGQYSLGMKQRLGIARALLGRPAIVILDEPTNGLDPHGIKDIRELIRSLASDGVTVLVSSHILGEVELVADSVSVIDEGATVAHIDLVTARASTDSLEIELDQPARAATDLQRQWPSANCTVVNARTLLVSSVAEGAGAVNSFLVRSGHTVRALVPRRWSLENEVMKLMKKEL